MTLIKSISGIRGTIGGRPEDGLNPVSIARFTSAYAAFVREKSGLSKPRIVLGRDARISGLMLKQVVMGSLMGMGCDVIDIDLATTPTCELAVTGYRADGGIILTASHNPKEWNALKLLGANGEFLTDAEGKEIIRLAETEEYSFSPVDQIGEVVVSESYTAQHIEQVLALPAVDVEAISNAGFSVAVDAVNSVGGIAIPALLEALGVRSIYPINAEPTGEFAHNPEPLPAHLSEIMALVPEVKADIGFVVDPDVDRLAIVSEDGTFFGEEYTLVAIADYLLSINKKEGATTVSNLSSSRALKDVTIAHGGVYSAAAVGEVNVVAKMKEVGALIGGEGNGGVIYPESHYGRDALVGVALFLTLMAKTGKRPSELRASYPVYFMSKQKVVLPEGVDPKLVLQRVQEQYAEYKLETIDGVKIDFPESWVHMRASNTEPIMRIYTEAHTQAEADALADQFVAFIAALV